MSFRKKIICVPYGIIHDNIGIIFILGTEGGVLFASPYLFHREFSQSSWKISEGKPENIFNTNYGLFSPKSVNKVVFLYSSKPK